MSTTTYTIKYNRTTNHIAGIEAKCTSDGNESGGVVATYAENACGSLTKYRMATGPQNEDLATILEAARRQGGRRLCKNCEKAAVAALAAEEEAKAAEVATAAPVAVEGAEHQVGDELYFIPGTDRAYGYAIPAGPVVVIRVIDHVQATMYAPRFSYVVQVPNVPAATQGASPTELHKVGSVPNDYRLWETYTTAICADCRQDVTYANSKIVREEIQRAEGALVYPGMMTHVERRVCARH